jgi:hypothetical protein
VTTDHSATTETEQVATTEVGGRQTSLTEHAEDAAQTTLDAHADPATDTGDGDRRDLEAVNAFPMRDVLLVNHYFEGDGAFAALQPYYDQREYRFEVPQSDLETVQDELAEHGYRLRVVDYLAAYAVVVRKYSHHPESVFEDAVAQFSNAEFNVFLLKDEAAVETAVRSGAQRLTEAPVEVRFPAANGTGPLTVADVTADR